MNAKKLKTEHYADDKNNQITEQAHRNVKLTAYLIIDKNRIQLNLAACNRICKPIRYLLIFKRIPTPTKHLLIST